MRQKIWKKVLKVGVNLERSIFRKYIFSKNSADFGLPSFKRIPLCLYVTF